MLGIVRRVVVIVISLILASVLFTVAADYVLGKDVTSHSEVKKVVERTERLADHDFSKVRVRYGGKILDWLPGHEFEEVSGMNPFFASMILVSSDIPLDAAHSELNKIISHELCHVQQ